MKLVMPERAKIVMATEMVEFVNHTNLHKFTAKKLVGLLDRAARKCGYSFSMIPSGDGYKIIMFENKV